MSSVSIHSVVARKSYEWISVKFSDRFGALSKEWSITGLDFGGNPDDDADQDSRILIVMKVLFTGFFVYYCDFVITGGRQE